MVSVELVFAYLAIVLVFVTIFVLCCLVCSCHVPLGKCVRWVCDETRRCCREQTKPRTEPETAALAKDEPPCAGCLRGVPWVLTCGYCCGTFGDAFTTDRQRAESAEGGKKPPVVVGQPVFDKGEPTSNSVGGKEHVVAVTMPLLAVC